MQNKLRKNDEWSMDRAAYYAQRSTLRYKHGALIVATNGGEIGYGWNVDLSIAQYRDDWTLHAEGFAIERALHHGFRSRLAGSTLYSARISHNYYD